MKLAIVGGGISGLSCAWHLMEHHDVVVYESNGYPGGHTDTHIVNIKGQTFAVDTGFIVFNELNYPNFTHMLKQLGVAWEDSDMSFSAVNERSGMEYGADGLHRLLAQRRNLVRPTFYQMLWDLARFYREAHRVLKYQQDPDITLGEYLRKGKYSQSFIDNHIIPMACALWSASAEIIEEFPLHYFLAFMDNHRMLQVRGRPQWKVVQGGSSQYVKKLIESLNEKIRRRSGLLNRQSNSGQPSSGLRAATPVLNVSRAGVGVTVTSERYGSEPYDAVIFACHSDQALALLQNPTDQEIAVLGAIPYQENHIVLHSDSRVMPAHKAAWASWNARIPNQGSTRCHVNYWMNNLQNIDCDTPFIVSLNSKQAIDPKKILAERTYHHPVFTRETLVAQQARASINGVDRTWFCGAYWGWGFHEDGVKSALSVVDGISKAARDNTPARRQASVRITTDHESVAVGEQVV